MNRTIEDLFEVNWELELKAGDTMTKREDGQEMQVVFLAALQKLARRAGIIRQRLEIMTPSNTLVQAIFTSVFKLTDGTEVEFVGAADCSSRNTNDKFSNYPTAVAESRAEARCLRKALGIKMLSSEEIGLKENFGTLEASSDNKADSQLIVAIEKLCEVQNVPPVQVIEKIITDKERASSIFELSQLTTKEAQDAIGWLNEYKKVQTPEEQRTERKKELLSKKEQK